MPVYEHTYRNYEGVFRHRFRWWIVVEQEFRVLARLRIFKFLVLLSSIQVLLRLVQIVAYDTIVQDPNHPMAAVLSRLEGITVKSSTFFDFINFQTPVMFIILLYAGTGMICNDFRNNLMEIYFSKPLRWHDYLLGKAATLILLGLSVTALPALFLIAEHVILLPSWELAREAVGMASASLLFSLVLVVPTAFAVLACSSLLPGQNYAAITLFMLIVANSSMAGLLSGALRDRAYLGLSYPLAVMRLGQDVFGIRPAMFDMAWHWPFLMLSVTAFICLLIVARRVRRAEIPA